jgi:hypothetical protein
MSTIYLVVRRTWFDRACVFEGYEYGEGGTPVASFSRREDAAALRDQLERETRAQVAVPFRLGEDIPALSSLAEEEFCVRVQGLGLTPPKAHHPFYESYTCRYWAAWYDALAGSLTSEQKAGLWALLDRVRSYQVTEIELNEEDP